MKWVWVLDLTRFDVSTDAYGSGDHEQNTIQIAVTFDTTVTAFLGEGAIGANMTSANFTIESFLVSETQGELKNGIYHV